MKFSEEQIKAAFWKEFHKSGELWFNYLGTDKENENSTEASWLEFFETLVEIAGGYNEDI